MRPLLLILALLWPFHATAFYPTKFRANLSVIPGISHEQMTEEVLASIAGTLFPPVASSLRDALGVSLSRSMLEARREIVRSNVRVDAGYPIPAYHFDGESDAESAELLESLKAALVKNLAEENYGEARANLGNALHLVQDYFAYRGSDVGSAGWKHLHQKKDAKEAQQDIIGLVSGNSDRHLRAVRWAKKASEAFLIDIAQYVTDRQLQHLFGISLDSAILVDPVAFASADWEKAQAKIGAMFNAAREFDPEENRAVRHSTVALLSQSPLITYDKWSPLKSSNASKLLEILRDTVSGYGIGCRGIDPATVLSALKQFQDGGELILVVGQGFFADSDVENQIIDLLANNPVAVTIMQLETKCQEKEALAREAFTLSQSVTDLSDGEYITSLDASHTLTFPRDDALEAPAGLSVIQRNSYSNSTSGDDIRFLVDGAMDKLVITADWTVREKSPMNLLFSDPEDKTFEPVARSTSGNKQSAVWRVDDPAAGEWGFNFRGSAPSYNVTIKGRSPIQLVAVSFVESGGIAGHEGYFDIQKDVLPAEADLGVVGEIYGLSSGENTSVEWFIVDAATGGETKIRMTPGLDPEKRPGFADQNTFFGNATLPEGSFYVVVRGVDAQGYKFQRSVPTRISAKVYPDETYEIGDVDSVVNFPDEDKDESEPDMGDRYSLLVRQIATGTGTAPTGQVTPPIGAILTPSSPFFSNSTSPGTGTTTRSANATATSPIPTILNSAMSSFLGISPLNTSIPSVTIRGPTSANFTSLASVTQTAGPLEGTAVPVPLSLQPGSTETLTTVATALPSGPLGTNVTSRVPSTSFRANATIISVTVKGESGGSYPDTVTVTAPCGGAAPLGETMASQDAIPWSPDPSSRTAGRVCETQSPAAPIPSSPKEAFTEAQQPVSLSYSPPEKPRGTVVIPNTVPAQKTVETTKTRVWTSVVPAQTVCAACAASPCGPASAAASTPASAPANCPAPSPKAVGAPTDGPGPFATGSVNGTQPRNKSHADHTTASRGAESSSEAEETASGEGNKGARERVVAVVVVAVGGVVFLVL